MGNQQMTSAADSRMRGRRNETKKKLRGARRTRSVYDALSIAKVSG